MSEFITIQVGQCGNQIGNSLWPLILQEYEISSYEDSINKTKNSKPELQSSMSSFFDINTNKFQTYNSLKDVIKTNIKARVICVDMEDSVVGRYKTGKYKNLFDRRCFITNYPGSGNNWAEGYFDHGPKYKETILEAIQYSTEKCDNLNGFLLLFSAGGGTGSGLGTFILKLLADYYPSVERFVICVYPTGTEDVITCPYNMALATQELLSNATNVFPIENRALLDILSKGAYPYKRNYSSMFRPFEDMNNIIVNMILHLTSGSRFPGSLNFDMNEINTNMVPFPKLNYLSSGFSPINLVNSKSVGKKDEIFLSACHRNNQLIKIDPLDRRETAMSTTLLGRGNYTIGDMRKYVDKLKSKLHNPPWSKKNIKVGLCNTAPSGNNLAMFTLFNTSSMSKLFENICNQYKKLYNRKAHVHHYTNVSGFESDYFLECKNTLYDIIEAYQEIQTMKHVKIPRLCGSHSDLQLI